MKMVLKVITVDLCLFVPLYKITANSKVYIIVLSPSWKRGRRAGIRTKQTQTGPKVIQLPSLLLANVQK